MAKVNMMSLLEDPPKEKIGHILTGYSVDGVAHYAPVTIPADSEVCKQCEGTGKWHYNAGNDGFERWETCKCEVCDGEGVVCTGEEQEDE
jgi:hypothetical protein